MILTEDKIFETLKTVIDPEIGINIVDLGLIYNIEFDENNVTVTMTLTTPGCPMHNSITNWVKEALIGIGVNIAVNVNLVWVPPWSPDYMSNDAKRQLGRL
jgi:metal-sulfur cluster biosynthetic enzyme